MKTITAIILMTSIAFSQTKCVIDPEDVELLSSAHQTITLGDEMPAQDVIEFQITESGLISYSWLKVDSIFHNGKPDCIHEWKVNKPDYSKIRYIKKQNDTIRTESKNYTRICAKCIRREAIREESATRTKDP